MQTSLRNMNGELHRASITVEALGGMRNRLSHYVDECLKVRRDDYHI